MQMEPKSEDTSEARRRFLVACGKFSVATPPAIALLLASAERNFAVAQSGGDHDGDDRGDRDDRDDRGDRDPDRVGDIHGHHDRN